MTNPNPVCIIALVIVLIALISVGFFYLAKVIFKDSQQPSALTTTPTIQGIDDGEIVIADGERLYLLDTATMMKEEIPIEKITQTPSGGGYINYDIHALSSSLDGRYLLFNQFRKFFIYDLVSKKTHILDIDANPAANPLEMSSSIVVADTRTGPGMGGKHFIDLTTKEVISRTVAHWIKWASDGKHFAYAKDEIEWWNLGLGPSPANTSLFLGIIEGGTVTEKKLFTATPQKSFGVTEWINDDEFMVSESIYDEPIPPAQTGTYNNDSAYQEKWMNIWENPKTTYSTYSIKTGERTPLEDYKYEWPKVKDTISPSGMWEIIYEGELPNRDVYIVNKDGTEKIKIGNSVEAIWLPN